MFCHFRLHRLCDDNLIFYILFFYLGSGAKDDGFRHSASPSDALSPYSYIAYDMELHQIRSACFTCRDPCSNDQQIAVCCKTLFEGGCHRSVEKCIRISPAFFQYRMDTPDELKLTGNLVMRCDGY